MLVKIENVSSDGSRREEEDMGVALTGASSTCMYAAPAWWGFARAVLCIALVRPQKLQSWLETLKMACWLPWLHVQPTFYDPVFCL